MKSNDYDLADDMAHHALLGDWLMLTSLLRQDHKAALKESDRVVEALQNGRGPSQRGR